MQHARSACTLLRERLRHVTLGELDQRVAVALASCEREIAFKMVAASPDEIRHERQTSPREAWHRRTREVRP